MCKKILSVFALLSLSLALLFGYPSSAFSSKVFKIGILIPIDHAALRDIVAGFERVVNKAYPNAVTFNVQSAQGDIKLQRSIVELFVGQKYDLIVPVGTSATQMTLSQVKDIPIVSLAALYPERERQNRTPRNITGVLDEIGAKKKLDFIKGALPEIKILTLVYHVGNDKTHEEVVDLEAYAKELGIQLQTMAIQHLPDLETVGHSMAKESQGILILKDHLIASGIRILIPIAKTRRIPLISSDEGTVKEGATMALGVQESMIGEQGGALAVKILNGRPIEDLPMQEMQELTIFYNTAACKEINFSIKHLEEYASNKNYRTVNY